MNLVLFLIFLKSKFMRSRLVPNGLFVRPPTPKWLTKAENPLQLQSDAAQLLRSLPRLGISSQIFHQNEKFVWWEPNSALDISKLHHGMSSYRRKNFVHLLNHNKMLGNPACSPLENVLPSAKFATAIANFGFKLLLIRSAALLSLFCAYLRFLTPFRQIFTSPLLILFSINLFNLF